MPDRQFSAEVAASSISADALAELLRGLGDRDLLADADPALVQQLLASAVALYARKLELGGWISPFGDPGCVPAPTAAEVCAAVSQMLDAVSVEIFELALWKSWTHVDDECGDGR